jgi:hypothetical protein
MKNLINEGQTDRIIRLAVGIIAGFIGLFYTTGLIQVIMYVVAFLGLFTGITGMCLLYKLFEINTNKK